MQIVYMGLFSKIFNAVFNAILEPIFKFIMKLLSTVLTWLFETILGPLLKNILWPIFTALLEIIFEALAGIIYSIYASLLEIIDAMQTMFNIFAGITEIGYKGQNTTYPMIELVFRMDSIQKAVLIVTAIGFVLAMLFAVIATARSMLELDVDNQRPISRVLSATFRAMIRFALIPICCLFLIMMSGRILTGINVAFGTDNVKLGRVLFVISSLDACTNKDYNISGKAKDNDPVSTTYKQNDIGINDKYRKPFYDGTKDYANKDLVGQDFKFARFDYMIGFVAGIFLVYILASCLLIFVSRIFEVMLLFIASPLFVSTMPLDDGEKFNAWRDMFVGKIFSGFGTVLAMNLYLLVAPKVMQGDIVFVTGDSSTEANYLIRLIFLVGGAWATLKAGPTITQLINQQAGMQEQGLSSAATGAVTFAASTGLSAAEGVTGWAVGKVQKFKGDSARRAQERNDRINKNLGYQNLGTDENGNKMWLNPDDGSITAGGKTLREGSPENKLRASALLSGNEGGRASGGNQNQALGAHPEAGSGAAAGQGGEGGGQGSAANIADRGQSQSGAGAEGSNAANIPDRDQAQGQAEGQAQDQGQAGGQAEDQNDLRDRLEGAGEGAGEQAGAEGGNAANIPDRGAGAGAEAGAGAGVAAAQSGDESAIGKRAATLFGGHFSVGKTKGGRYFPGVHFGKFLNVGYNEKGKFNIRVLGFGYGEDKKGNKKIYTPFASWKKETGKPGGFTFSKMKAGVFSFKRGTNDQGKAYLSNFKVLGTSAYKAKYDSKTGKVETLQSLGTHYAKNAQGQYVKTDTNYFGVRTEYKQGTDGKSYASHRSFFGLAQTAKNQDGSTKYVSFGNGEKGNVYKSQDYVEHQEAKQQARQQSQLDDAISRLHKRQSGDN